MSAVAGFGLVAYGVTAYKMTDTAPAGPVVMTAGGSQSFSVFSGGSGLSYQWKVKKASGYANASGTSATTATLTINPTATTDSGTYQCVVTGPGSSTWTSTGAALTVNPASLPTPTVTVTDNSSGSGVCGNSATFTATLTGGSSPGGAVQFKDGGNNLGAAQTVSGGIATLATSSLTRGNHTITAVYSGDSNNNGATSASHAFSVTIPVNTSIWQGGGADNNFSTTANWQDGNCNWPDPSGGSALHFDGSTRTSPNLENNYTVTSLTFDSTIGASFSIGSASSKTLTVGATGIANNSATYDQTISAKIVQGGVNLVVNTGTKQIELSGDNTGTAGYAVNGSGTLYLSLPGGGNIGGPVIINNGATLRLKDYSDLGANDGVQAVTINGGTLRVDGPAGAGNGQFLYKYTPATIGAGGGTFNLPNAGEMIIASDVAAKSLLAGSTKLTITGIGDLTFSNATANTFTGNIDIQNHQVTIKKASNVGTSPTITLYGTSILELDLTTALPSGATVTLPASPAASSVILNLAGGTQTITALDFDGTSKAQGTWGASGSGAAHQNAAFTGSGLLNVTSGGAATTTVLSTITPNPSCGGSLSLTATVTGSSLSGNVEFFDGASSLGTAPLASGSATKAVSLSVGSHPSITANYLGDDDNNQSTSGAGSVTMNAIATTSGITGSTAVAIGQLGAAYAVTPTSGSSYAWTVPSDASITAGAGTASITVNFGSASGNVTVTETASGACVGAPVSLGVTVGPNHAPVARNKTQGTVKNTASSFANVKLLAGATDADNDTLSVSAAGPTSQQGGTAALEADDVKYTPPTGFMGSDSYTYTISDGQGGTAVGTVDVAVTSDSATPPNVVSTSILPNGHFHAVYAGIPSYTYRVEGGPACDGPWTNCTGSWTAGNDGLFEFEDTTEPPPGTCFYRAVCP